MDIQQLFYAIKLAISGKSNARLNVSNTVIGIIKLETLGFFAYFYRQRYKLISKFDVGLKLLLHQGLS